MGACAGYIYWLACASQFIAANYKPLKLLKYRKTRLMTT